MHLYSTISKRKEPLVPGPDGTVGIYVCGPTVYGRIHIGNARPFVVFSVLKRFLERRGVRVRLVSNLTDVNDKIYDAAPRPRAFRASELARRYSEAYIADTDRLGLGRPDAEPRVTESVPGIIDLIAARWWSAAWPTPPGGDVYYRVERFPGYGALSGRRLEDMVSGEPGPRGKESPLDFALWKGRKPDEDTWWESPWGPGRPGWHIECSAMAEEALGHGFEVHGGGIDLIFPHHENEIAQSEGAHGGRMAQIWMHNEMLELGDEKMSKSLGNIAPLSDVLDRWPAEVVIAYFLTSHYRSRLPFSEERHRRGRVRWSSASPTPCARSIAPWRGAGEGHDADLTARDRGRPRASSSGRSTTTSARRRRSRPSSRWSGASTGRPRPATASPAQLREARHELLDLLDVLGLAGIDPGPAAEVPEEVAALLDERERARAARDFAGADALRDRIRALGFEVTDTRGPQASPIAPEAGSA